MLGRWVNTSGCTASAPLLDQLHPLKASNLHRCTQPPFGSGVSSPSFHPMSDFLFCFFISAWIHCPPLEREGDVFFVHLDLGTRRVYSRIF